MPRTLILTSMVVMMTIFGCQDGGVDTGGDLGMDGVPADLRGALRAEPATADFGQVCAEHEQILPITLFNDGDATLRVTGMGMADGSSPDFELVVEDEVDGVYAPGDSRSCNIRYTPTGDPNDTGTLLLWLDGDPNPFEIPLSGSAGGPQLEVWPGDIDFGGVPVGETAYETIELYNSGGSALSLLSLQLVTGYGSSVLWIDAFDVWSPLPWALEPGESASVTLGLAPTWFAEPSDAPIGHLEVWSTDCHQELQALPIQAWPGGSDLACAETSTVSESFVGKASEPTDVLFVVDNSESMLDEQKKLSANFASFIQSATALAIDYRIAVTTTDMEGDKGHLVGEPPVVTPATWEAFMANVVVGTGGSVHERGLDALYTSLTSSHAFQPYLRPDALLVVILVSDEQDQSTHQPTELHEKLVALKGGDPSNVLVHAIVGPSSGCESANYGWKYIDLAELSGGGVASICAETFADTMLDFGTQTFASRTLFELGTPAVAGTVSITVDGAACEAGWTLDADARTVVFEPDAACLPDEGQAVVISYDPVCQ